MGPVHSSEAQSVLLICLSNSWGTQEKAVWRDLLSLTHVGKNMGLICTRNSFLYQLAIKKRFQVFPYSADSFSRFFDTKFYFFLKNILAQHNFQLIKTYNPKSLYPVAFLLRLFPQMGLILGLYREELRGRKRFFDPFFHSRVDEVLVPSRDLIPYVARSLAIGQGRINVVPLGIEVHTEWEQWKKKYPPAKLAIGTLLSADAEELSTVDLLLNAFSSTESWVSEHLRETQIELWIFSERPWRERIIFEDLNQMLWEKNLSTTVILKDLEMGQEMEAINSCDIWIGLEEKVALGHDVLLALVQGMPAIHIRTSAAAQLARRPNGLLTTFAIGNARELRQKIIESIKKLKDAGPQHPFSQRIRSEHAPQHYTDELLKHFNRALTRRARALSQPNPPGVEG